MRLQVRLLRAKLARARPDECGLAQEGHSGTVRLRVVVALVVAGVVALNVVNGMRGPDKAVESFT